MPSLRSFILALLLLATWPLFGESVRLKLELDRGTYRESVQNNLYLKATVDLEGGTGAPTDRTDVVFLVDRSGSMEGEKLEQTKLALNHGLSLLSSNDTVSIITFGSEVETLISKTPVDQLSAHASAIENLTSEGGSSLYDGIETAIQSLRHNNSNTKKFHTILITDGPPNKGPRDPGSFAPLFSRSDEEPINFTTLYLSEDASEQEKQALITLLPNQPILVDSPSSLSLLMADTLETQDQILGADAVLEIDFASGIEIEESIGRESEVSGRTIRFDLGDIRRNQELSAITQATLSASKAIFSRTKIATATLRYTPVGPSDFSKLFVVEEIDATFTPSSSSSFDSINTHIYQAVCEGEVADTIRESNEWVKDGRVKKALRELKKLARNIRSVADDLPELRVDEPINQLNKAIQQIESTRDSSIENAAKIETLYPSASSLTSE